MATFITRLHGSGSGPRLAVKDLIDVAGVPTTAGCQAVADMAEPATADAACMSGARAADAAIVGKANLHELAYGAAGVNDWYGTPVNPLDPALLPGGSSSGSAVAVATGEADVAYGSDTGGSIRVPAAFCGIAGLKTTHGRVPLDGVWPLAPSLDTVGPMATDVAGLRAGMRLLEPGFTVARQAGRVGRLRIGVNVDPRIDAAVDAALRSSELEVEEIPLPTWQDAVTATYTVLDAEAARANAALTADPRLRERVGPQVLTRLDRAAAVTAARERGGREFARAWRATLDALLRRVEVLVLATVPFFPPPLAERDRNFTSCTAPVNLSGLPALALPVRSEHRLPASLQLIGPADGEDLLLATAAEIESAAGWRRP